MHVGDTIFIFCLALIIFGPKKLPEIGRQIGKLMVEFRRASNEFKMQIDEELRASDEAERQKEINAAKAALPAVAAKTAIPAGPAELTSSTAGSEATTPVTAPPMTGLPVNHTFPSAGSELVEGRAAEAAAEPDAYPEPADGFNPGLNTASNAEIAEIPLSSEAGLAGEPVASPGAVRPVNGERENASGAEELAVEKAQAAFHHG